MYNNYLFLTISLTISTLGISQGCPTNLFFSEYIEGSSNNKALEIYNPLPYTVDLNDYVIERYTNGSTTVSGSFFLGGSIASGGTYVICNNLASSTFLAIKDTVSGVLIFNGDDAMVLKHEFTFDTLDIIGKIGNDPGTFWPVTGSNTENHTLVRNSTIGIGTTNWMIGATQWTGFPLDYIDSLGTHYCSAPSNSYTFENYTICSNDSVHIQMSHYESLAGIYYDTLVSFNGCDSVIVTELFTNQGYLISKDTSTCPGGSLFLGGANQTVPGYYFNYYSTVFGCDSIIAYNFNFYEEELLLLNLTICEGDSVYLEGGWQSLDGVYSDSYISILTGCDSIVETTLSVNIVDVSVLEGMFDLTAVATGVNYQWAICSPDYIELAGETNMQFSPVSDGYYAVEITNGACVDTSTCFLLQFENIDEQSNTKFHLYPNPSHSMITIDLGETNNATIELISVDGKLVQSISLTDKSFVDIDLTELEIGIYLVVINTENKNSILRFVKN